MNVQVVMQRLAHRLGEALAEKELLVAQLEQAQEMLHALNDKVKELEAQLEGKVVEEE